ncbi:MAG: hypothetical protein EPN45_23170, partial [Rhizobiaceae bacterium]
MRIPLLHADFEHGSYTKIAKALRKVWPLGDQSLMQAQNALAVVLGYNSLHDAQREATASFSVPDGSLSMEKIAYGVAWRMFVRYGIDLLMARTLVSKLHLTELAVAGISLEEKMRRATEDAWKKGFFRDEMWDYMTYQEPWPEETPRLLEKGVPPYKWAVFPDRSVFLWSKLVSQIEMLPEDFTEDLRQTGKLGSGPDAVESFMMNSLMPAACQPLTAALATGMLTTAMQWQVKWIVTQQAEVLGCCIVAGRLGGMIPRVFAPDRDDVYAAQANLMCGDVVSEATIPEADTRVSEPVWLIDRDRLQKLKDGQGSDLLKSLWYHDQWPSTIELYRGLSGCRLAGLTRFSERGQSYLATTNFDAQEQRRLLREEPLFETFALDAGLLDEAGAERGIPALGNRWHDAVERMLSGRQSDAEAAMGTPAGVDTLMTAVLATTDAAKLDAFVAQAINECLPLRYEGDTEDNEDLISDRQRAVSLAEHLGNSTIANMSGLLPYSTVSLGYMLLVANGEYPGSRYQGMVDVPTPTDSSSQSRLLAAMLIYEPLSARQVSRMALSCAIAPVLGLGNGTWAKDKIGMWYQSACTVETRLKEAKKQLKEVDEWRGIEIEVARVRAQGEFLRMGDP